MATAEDALPARVVPSGKVYRQMFDAEVQLVKALEKRESTLLLKRSETEEGAGAAGAAEGIPIVRQSRRTTGTGILDERQRTWVESFPNEPHVENPVVHKFFTQEQNELEVGARYNAETNEVRGLPDVLIYGPFPAPAKVGSDIIERIGKSREQRHEATIEDLHQELGVTNQELEPLILQAGQRILEKLHEDDRQIEQVMERIKLDDDLVRYRLEDLNELWAEVAAHSTHRREWINALDAELAAMEAQRMAKVREIFQSYAKQLERIAHLMPPDLQRVLDKESQLINQTVLSNRRAYADLYSRLMMADIEREKRLHTQWETRVEEWGHLHTEAAIAMFRSFMESEEVVSPSGAKMVLEHMRTDQAALNQRRVDLINSLRDLKPPSSTKTSVYHWNQQVMDASKEIDVLNQEYFTKLYKEYEKVCQTCLTEVEKVKEDLVSRGICSEPQAKQVVHERCLPLVGEQQTKFEKALEEMDKTLESHNAYLLEQLKSLFKFCQGSAHLWDVHEIGLARQERALQEKLDTCRHGHDNQNQEREAQLDIIMDRMRQDANEAALKESLKVALDMLNKIRDGYEDFHGQQIDIVATYPTMVSNEVKSYDKAMCKFFSVDRRHPDQIRADWEQEQEELEAQQDVEDEKEEETKGKKKKKKATGGETSRSEQASRASSIRSESNQERVSRSPLPMAVREVLSTAKGTTFYLLTVAGEHGIIEKDEQKSAGCIEPDAQKDPAFLTETGNDTTSGAVPEYLKNADVPDDLILSIKKAIRMNFLNHLEEWGEQSGDRARSVVAAKTEELNSELDLRMHLHQPRARRAELDVHNVRAAELVMHSERVARHCKGIHQALGDLKTRFNDMTEEHNQLADKFRHDIEALEVIFINATKSAKLVALTNQLQVEQEKYMNVIRTSLRQFRQHLDDTLQMLRESNARFIKSFKVFSDGGNFCPEEIEDFRKRLEKMAQKIDSSEGFIMADLEGMESKRLDQATKISSEFEDRFKHHMVDLVFMEKIARWLTNTQVKVKAEVADSNTQAQKLTKALNDLERKIDACERPNPDKEPVTPAQLNEGLRQLFDAFHDRSRYLNCIKDSNPPPPPTPLQGNPAQAAMRVGFTSESIPPVSKPGKQPVEDPSVGVIKNILKTQKTRLKGLDSDTDGDFNMPAPTAGGPVLLTVPGQYTDKQHPKPRPSRPPTDTESRSKRSSRQGTATSVAVDTPKRAQSGRKNKKEDDEQKRVPGKGRFGSLESLRSSMMSASFTSLISHPRRGRHVACSKGTKFDPKYMVFGPKEEAGEDSHFLGKVRRLLREALDGLLSAAEIYYRSKGNRPVTRPQALQETFEQCADIVVAKLQSYFSQAEEFHNQCLQEVRQQLQRLETTVTAVPAALIRELLATSIRSAEQERTQIQEEFAKKLNEWDNEKVYHQQQLRPTLGHPQQDEELRALCGKEDARRKQYLQGVEEHMKALQEVTVRHAQMFVDRLAKTAEQLILQADSLLTVDDVERGRVPQVKHSTAELLRRQNAGEPLEDVEPKETMNRGKSTWPGLPKNKFVVPSNEPTESKTPEPAERKSARTVAKERKAAMTASITTAKTTLAHSTSQRARDQAYQDYEQHFKRTLEAIAVERQRLEVAEQRWTDSWRTSVNKVKQLY